MGGSKKKSTQTFTPPSWVESASKQAIDLGKKIGSQEYTAYEGQRVAGLSQNERRGISMAGTSSALAQPYLDESADLTRRGTMQFKDANISDYINPFVKNALDPAARELEQSGARRITAIGDRAASMNAFGGRRAALAQQDERELTLQSVSDLYGRGYAAAYESAVGIWGDERTRDMQAAGRFQQLGETRAALNETDIATLMTTGATDRSIQQALADFDFEQFSQERDWDFRNLAGLLAAIQGTRGSYSTTTTNVTKTSSNPVTEVLGITAQVAAAIYMGGGS